MEEGQHIPDHAKLELDFGVLMVRAPVNPFGKVVVRKIFMFLMTIFLFLLKIYVLLRHLC